MTDLRPRLLYSMPILLAAIFLLGCIGQPKAPNVKITEAYFSSNVINDGHVTTLFVKAKNYENNIVRPIILEVSFNDKDKPYLKVDEISKNLGSLGIGEDTGLKGFQITGNIPAGASIDYDIIVKVVVNETVTDSKLVKFTVKK